MTYSVDGSPTQKESNIHLWPTYQHVSRTNVTPKASNFGTDGDLSYNAREMLGEGRGGRKSTKRYMTMRKVWPNMRSPLLKADQNGTYQAITETSLCFLIPSGTSCSNSRSNSSHSVRERCGFPNATHSIEL